LEQAAVRQEHLLTIAQAYDAMNRRDLAALRELDSLHPEFSWQSAPDELDAPGRLDGRETIAYSTELFEVFDELRTEIERTIDLGPSQVIHVVRDRVRGAASGVRAERSEAHLWTVRDGRVASLREFRTVEEAREAAQAL
jgi:ketosteroid isomerase-like protein